jgi:hypothetical protein
MSAMQILLVVAAVIYVIGRRFAGSPVGSRSLVLPVVLTGYGLVQLAQGHGIGALSIGLLVVEMLIAVVAGGIRAATIKLYVQDGHLWQKYSMLTLAVWIGLIVVRIGTLAVGNAMGAHLPEGPAIMATFGVSMVIESLVVAKRAASTGVPILPQQSKDQRRDQRRMDRRAGVRF